MNRREEIQDNLRRVRDRLANACVAAGRSPDEVTLIAVTKTYPASDVAHLAALGLLDIGENRDQEAAPKAAEVAALRAEVPGADVRWHFIGQLQRNKARSVVRYAHMVQSVDSVRLAETLADAADRLRDSPLDVLIQVSIDRDPERGGVTPDELDRVAETVTRSDSLRLRGLMAVAPLEWEPAAAFEALAGIAERFRAAYPTAAVLSAGMSADLEVAVRFGATHVRVGSALLGNRLPVE